jgi:hypothetical protein
MERDERGKIRKVISEGEVRLPIALIIGEEIARELAERVAESVPKPERLVTRTLDRRGFEITSATELIDKLSKVSVLVDERDKHIAKAKEVLRRGW